MAPPVEPGARRSLTAAACPTLDRPDWLNHHIAYSSRSRLRNLWRPGGAVSAGEEYWMDPTHQRSTIANTTRRRFLNDLIRFGAVAAGAGLAAACTPAAPTAPVA